MTAIASVKRALKEVASSAGSGETGHAWSGVRAEIESILHDLDGERAEHMPALRSRLQTLLDGTQEAVTDKAGGARALARQGMERGRARALAACDATTSYVREHPGRALAVVGAVGLLIGILGRRR